MLILVKHDSLLLQYLILLKALWDRVQYKYSKNQLQTSYVCYVGVLCPYWLGLFK
jgi:hypothetical protein